MTYKTQQEKRKLFFTNLVQRRVHKGVNLDDLIPRIYNEKALDEIVEHLTIDPDEIIIEMSLGV